MSTVSFDPLIGTLFNFEPFITKLQQQQRVPLHAPTVGLHPLPRIINPLRMFGARVYSRISESRVIEVGRSYLSAWGATRCNKCETIATLRFSLLRLDSIHRRNSFPRPDALTIVAQPKTQIIEVTSLSLHPPPSLSRPLSLASSLPVCTLNRPILSLPGNYRTAS